MPRYYQIYSDIITLLLRASAICPRQRYYCDAFPNYYIFFIRGIKLESITRIVHYDPLLRQ